MPPGSSRRRTRSRARLPLSALLAVIVTAIAGAPAASAAVFTRGFADSVYVWPGTTSQTPRQWAEAVHEAGGRVAEVEVDWLSYEPDAPTPGVDVTNPGSSDYANWTLLDSAVKNLVAAGVEPMFLVTDAPAWAQANNGADTQTEGYEPNDAALESFVQALATRYGGHYPDPNAPGEVLPRVRYYEDWAEANLPQKLAPAWNRVNGTWVDAGATLYRNMLNDFYAGVKAVNPGDQVVFTGLESYGDAPGTANGRVPPVTFLEDVLCLSRNLQRVCNDPAHFDIMAADPYDVGSPTTSAVSPTDASAPNLGRLTKVVNAGLRAGTVLPDVRKPLWVTEFSYDSDPPNPGGLPLAKEARWMDQAFYTFWREGVSTVLWYLIRDDLGDDYSVDYFSGIYFANGAKKLSYAAYSFPLVVAKRAGRAQFWGIAPRAGTVSLERKTSAGWVTLARLRRPAGAVFDGFLPISAHGSYRAVDGGDVSLAWSY